MYNINNIHSIIPIIPTKHLSEFNILNNIKSIKLNAISTKISILINETNTISIYDIETDECSTFIYIGINNINKNTKENLMNFSFYLTVGNLYEAYRSVENIKSHTI